MRVVPKAPLFISRQSSYRSEPHKGPDRYGNAFSGCANLEEGGSFDVGLSATASAGLSTASKQRLMGRAAMTTLHQHQRHDETRDGEGKERGKKRTVRMVRNG
jgi:hypothetical protein